MNSHVLIDKNHQNRSKTIKNRKNHPGAFPEFFSIFLEKLHFSRIFQLFGTAPWRHFRDFARSAMQSTLAFLTTGTRSIDSHYQSLFSLSDQWVLTTSQSVKGLKHITADTLTAEPPARRTRLLACRRDRSNRFQFCCGPLHPTCSPWDSLTNSMRFLQGSPGYVPQPRQGAYVSRRR